MHPVAIYKTYEISRKFIVEGLLHTPYEAALPFGTRSADSPQNKVGYIVLGTRYFPLDRGTKLLLLEYETLLDSIHSEKVLPTYVSFR